MKRCLVSVDAGLLFGGIPRDGKAAVHQPVNVNGAVRPDIIDEQEQVGTKVYHMPGETFEIRMRVGFRRLSRRVIIGVAVEQTQDPTGGVHAVGSLASPVDQQTVF